MSSFTGSDKRSDKLLKVLNASAYALLILMISLPQSYSSIKVAALLAFLISYGLMLLRSPIFLIKTSDAVFYSVISVLGVIWAVVGLIRGNELGGILDGIKLYVAWGAVFLVIITSIRNAGALRSLHKVFVISTFLIVGLNLAAVVCALDGYDFLPADFIEELGLHVQLYDSFIKLHANNIASMFFLVPYLMACWLVKNEINESRFLDNIALLAGLLLVFISGRRALWVVVIIMPLIICLIVCFSGRADKLLPRAKIFLRTYVAILALVGGFFLVVDVSEVEIFNYYQTAFSEEDERSIQKKYLIDGFLQYPFIGSGFGGYAGYLRSEEMPWLYELTYHQMIFNFGIVGCAIASFLFLFFLTSAFNKIRNSRDDVKLRIGILSGFVGILIGAYSNPYLQFFDSMVFIMLFVLISDVKYFVGHKYESKPFK